VKRYVNSILDFLDISRKLNKEQLTKVSEEINDLPLDKIPALIEQLELQMKESAKNLAFEEAAKYRDQIQHLRQKLLGH
jgi:excinuclease ABC subunit B